MLLIVSTYCQQEVNSVAECRKKVGTISIDHFYVNFAAGDFCCLVLHFWMEDIIYTADCIFALLPKKICVGVLLCE